MKTIFPWFCVAALGAGVAYLYIANTQLSEELAALRQQAQELQTIRTELESTRSAAAAQTEAVAQLKKDSEDTLRLRNEVRQLREEKQQIDKQLQTAQKASATALQQAQQQAEQAKATAQRLQSAARQSEEASLRNACINQLRMLDGAMQQWALENNKTKDARPTMLDLTPYLRNGSVPVCPGGGNYVFSTVEKPPTCTIAGHVLPEPQPEIPEAPKAQ